MAVATQPVAFLGTFQLVADPTLPPDGIRSTTPVRWSPSRRASRTSPVQAPSQFPSVLSSRPGRKGLLVRYDAAQPTGAAPVQLALNGSSTPIELTPGSLFVYFNAAPVSGLVSATFTVTAACQLRVWVLG